MLSNDNAKIKDLKLQLERDNNYFRTNKNVVIYAFSVPFVIPLLLSLSLDSSGAPCMLTFVVF
jgi:hypothetical protein